MIPKTIHYCWFGHGELPPLVKDCIASWKAILPDYQIVEWNESNFDFRSNPYVTQAYENRKFAFVSDFARLYALYHQGGIYLDTDVEVVRSFDKLLVHQAFSGFESPQHVGTALLASVPGHPFIAELLDEYNRRQFVRADGTLDTSTNVLAVTNSAVKHGLIPNGLRQEVNGMVVYPTDYFFPYDDVTGRKNMTSNTHCIHWFAKSWVAPRIRMQSNVTRIFHRVFGKNCFGWIKGLLGKSS